MRRSGEPVTLCGSFLCHLRHERALNQSHLNRVDFNLRFFRLRPRQELRPAGKRAIRAMDIIKQKSPLAAIILSCSCGYSGIATLLGRADEFINFLEATFEKEPELVAIVFLALDSMFHLQHVVNALRFLTFFG